MTVNYDGDHRSLSTLFTDLLFDAVRLIRQEIELAKAEASEKLSGLGIALGTLFVSGLVVFSGFLVLLDSAVFGITAYFGAEVPLWLSALIVGAMVTLAGLVALRQAAKSLSAKNLIPHRTIVSLERDKEFLKEKLQ